MSSLKYTFDKNAVDYRRYRPKYPSELSADIAASAKLQQGCRILEIGCGAGQATDLFAHLKPIQTSIDLGPNLTAQCIAQHSNRLGYEFICSSFEDYPGKDNSFDLIYAATCFHWITPGLRYIKSAALLKHSGHLAVFSDRHIKNKGSFFSDIQECYRRHASELVLAEDKSKRSQMETEDNPLMLVTQREYDRNMVYGADDYVGLLRTFSDHIALGEPRLKILCDCVCKLIHDRYDGKVTKTLTTCFKLYKKGLKILGAVD